MRKLSEIVELIGGYPFKSELYTNDGVRVVRIMNVQDGYFVDDNPCYYDTSIISELGNANLEENDLLMSLTGNVGRVAFLPKNMLPAGLNQRVECLRTSDMLIKRYLYYFFRSNRFMIDANKNATGVAQLNMSTKWLANYQIPDIERSKMNDIVKELDKINSLIKISNKEIVLYDKLVKSRFNEMFLSKNIVDKYVRKKWSDVVTIYNGKDYKSDLSDKKNGYPVFGSGGFMGVYADKYICEGTLTIIGRKGTIDKPLLVIGKIWNIDTAFAIKTNSRELNPIYFYYRSKFYDYLEMNKQTTKPSLRKSDLQKLDIEVPPMNLQNKFVSFIESIDKLKFSYLNRN